MAEADPISFHRSFTDAKLDDALDQSHRIRSRLLDAFAKLESEIHSLLGQMNLKQDVTAPIGAKISALRAAVLPDAKRKKVLDRILDELCTQCMWRGHIVHSAISPVFDLAENEIHIQFRTIPIEKNMRFSLRLDELSKLPHKVNSLTIRVKQFRQAPGPAAPAATSATA